MDRNYFIKQIFTAEELGKIRKAINRSLGIAQKREEPEVSFHFAYMTLIKMGIYCLARDGYRVKGKPGHHKKIIEYLSHTLKNKEILVVGDKMRRDRNFDLYSTGIFISEKELAEYIEFIEKINQLINR